MNYDSGHRCSGAVSLRRKSQNEASGIHDRRLADCSLNYLDDSLLSHLFRECGGELGSGGRGGVLTAISALEKVGGKNMYVCMHVYWVGGD